MSTSQDDDIAIVGMAGCYAGAADMRAYWRNILNSVDAVEPADDEWTGPYLDPDSGENDRIATNKGGFLRDLAEFDPTEFGIMPSTVDGSSPDMYLGLRLSRDALADAGYGGKAREYDGKRTGVILGCGAYFNRGEATLLQHGVAMDQALDLVRRVRPDFSDAELAELRAEMKARLPKFNSEMAPGLVPNVASGVIANRLDLMGPNYLVDAACSSSLLALEQSIRELRSGNIDMMLTGGVMAENSPQAFMLFTQLGALSRGDIRPFSANAGGTLLGEGAGMMVIKRVTDARRDGDRIHAVIKGVGSSSDGRAKGLLAPRLEGEVLALERAYANAGVDPSTVGLIEAHGTGISLGDKTEVTALTQVFGERRGAQPEIALGSVKSMISHCLPAAGSASLIKAALSLSHGVLPPTLCDEVNPELELERTPFYVNNVTRPWVHAGEYPRRAGVNAFGFGGINAHVVLEAHAPPRPVQVPVLHAPANSELFVLAGESAAMLCADARALAERVRAELTLDAGGLAKALAERIETGRNEHRLAIVARDTGDLADKLDKAAERIEAKGEAFKTRSGIHYGTGAPAGRVAFLFPGEGSQYAGMLADLAVAFPQVREWFDLLESTYGPIRDYRPRDVLFAPPTAVEPAARERMAAHLYDMDLASESVYTASQGLHTLLRALGVQADAMLGHSTGENSALMASGHVQAGSRDEIARISHAFNEVYRQVESAGEIATGTLLTVGAMPAERRDELLADFGDQLVVAMDNCPNQAVLFGAPDVVSAARERLAPEGAICAELPFGRAYHTAQFEPVATAFRRFYDDIDFGAGDVTLISCATGEAFPGDADGIRDLAAAQWAKPVRFREVLESLYDDGYRVFVEVGPSANLSAFVTDTLRGRGDLVSISTNSRRQPDTTHFFSAVAALFAQGVSMQPAALYAHRDLPAVDPDAAPGETRRKPRLKLTIPPLAPGPDWQARPLPESVARRAEDASDAISDAVQAPTQTAASAPEAPAAAEPPMDPRTAGMQSHFALMNEFLESQARVLGVGAPASAAPPPPTGGAPATAPLIGTVVSRSPDRLVAEHTISLARERYLFDHCLSGAASRLDDSLAGLSVVPFTFSMEMVAEAAQVLDGGAGVVAALEDINGSRWLGLPLGELAVAITAARDPGDASRFHVRIDPRPAEETQAPLFSATVVLASAYPEAPAPREWTARQTREPVVNPPGTLYSQGMFHGPGLQGVQRITRWADNAIEAEMAVLPRHDYLADVPQPGFAFDPALLDAAGQTVAYWATEHWGWGTNCFPYHIDRVSFHAPPSAADDRRLICRGDMSQPNAQTIAGGFDVIDTSGALVTRVEGWTDRCFTVPDWLRELRLDPESGFLGRAVPLSGGSESCARRLDALADPFFASGGGLWQDMLAQMTLNRAERTVFHALPAQGPRRNDWLAGRIAAKEAVRDWLLKNRELALGSADIEIVADANGKPFARCPQRGDLTLPAISLSHSRRRALAAAGPPELRLGVDMQWLDGIRAEDVASGGLAEDERGVLAGNAADTAANGLDTRSVVAAWCAKEAAAKADGAGLGGRPQEWRLQSLDWQAEQATAVIEHRGCRYEVHIGADADTVSALCRMAPEVLAQTAQA